MKRFVSIWFPYLVTDWFALQQTQLKAIPFVVKASSRGRIVIVAANAMAHQKGIREGMALADIRAIYPDIIAVDEKKGLTNQLYKRIAEWCIRFTPVASIDPLGGIILDATGCPHLWGSDEAYVQDIIKRLHAKGYQARAAMADTIGAAWAVVRYYKNILALGPGRQAEMLMDLPPSSLRINTAIAERLDQLGLYQVKDIVSMPSSALRRRFGKDIITRLNQAFGNEPEFIEGIQPEEPYQERLPCLEPIQRIEGIEIAVQRLLDSLCKQLSAAGKGVRLAQLVCYRIDGKKQTIEIGTSAASNNSKHLSHLYELKLGTIEPGLGIELFTLTASKVEDHIARQQQIWKQAGDLAGTRVSECMDRIAGRIGTHSIQRYLPAEHYLPEKSYKPATSLKDEANTEWYVDRPRPIILLPIPEVIEVTAPIPDYPPMMFRYKGKLHKVVKADGPERIEQEWWIRNGRHRDYYAIEDEEGCRYWLFRSGHYDVEKTYRWFLHGVFA